VSHSCSSVDAGAHVSGWPGGQYQPLDPADVDRIIEGALVILERAGVFVGSRQAFEAFAARGAIADPSSSVVRLPRSLVQACIDSAPRPVYLCGRDPKHDCCLHNQRVHTGTGGTALYVLDLESGRRRLSSLADVAACARLCDALENIHIFTINVFPNEIKQGQDIDVNRFYWSLKNTSKHVMGGCYTLDGLQQVIEMAQMVAGGPEALQRRPFISFITLAISPLKIDDLYGTMACHAAACGLPVVVATEPICGTTSPVTLAGNVLLHVAEMLAGLAMVQCVRAGAPVVCGSVGSVAGLRSMHHVSGAVERAMIQAAVAQVAQRLDLPLYSTAGTSDAKVVDAQAAYESALSNLLVTMAGAHYIHDACGLMEADLTVAYEKMVLDDEVLGMCARVLRGIEVTEETLAVGLICRVGPAHAYVAEEHTVRHMREEFFRPVIADRRPRDEWEKLGSPDATERARRRARELLEGRQPLGLAPEVDDSIRRRFPAIRDVQGF
jgi:trimethylamine--corrinoid protein Co-methyltransferase